MPYAFLLHRHLVYFNEPVSAITTYETPIRAIFETYNTPQDPSQNWTKTQLAIERITKTVMDLMAKPRNSDCVECLIVSGYISVLVHKRRNRIDGSWCPSNYSIESSTDTLDYSKVVNLLVATGQAKELMAYLDNTLEGVET